MASPKLRMIWDEHFDMASVDYTPGRKDLAYTSGRFGYNQRGEVVMLTLTDLSQGVDLQGVPQAEIVAQRLRRRGYLATVR